MKFILFYIICAQFFCYLSLSAQCLNGNCDKGYGEYKYKSGDIYKGEWLNGKKEGKGIYTFKNGDYQDGIFKDDFFEGFGTYFSFSDSVYTTCYWEKDRIKDGFVTVKNGHKLYYEGEMKDSRRDGFGKLYDDAFIYEGNFKIGRPDGNGKFFYTDGRVCEGNFKNGKMNGFGKYSYKDGNKFEGYFVDGVWEGYGTLYLSNGDKYEGNFLNGNYEGTGKYTFANGASFEGEYKKGSRNGIGVEYYADGSKFEGNFVNGKKEGPGIQYYAKGGKLEGNWKNGVFDSGINDEPKSTQNSTSTNSSKSLVIKLTKTQNNQYEISTKINQTQNVKFLINPFQNDILLNENIVLELLKSNALSNSDILSGGSYTDPNGKINFKVKFNIKEIEIGGKVIKNVSASISDSTSNQNVIGQNFLSKLNRFMIDYSNETLTIEN